MFMDEGRFGRISDTRRCWAPKNIRPFVGHQIVREYTYAYAAVSPFDGHLDALLLPDASTEAMSLFLQEVSELHVHEQIVMIMDRAGWHTARALKIPDNINLHWLPPYSPELNPVEHIWDDIREKWFCNRIFSSLEAVKNQLCKALLHLMDNPQIVKPMTLFKWMNS